MDEHCDIDTNKFEDAEPNIAQEAIQIHNAGNVIIGSSQDEMVSQNQSSAAQSGSH